MKKILLCLCLLLFLCGCGRKEAAPAPVTESVTFVNEPSTAFSLSVSRDYALSMLREALPDDCPLTVEGLEFSASEGIKVSGSTDLKALCALCELSYPSFLPSNTAFSSSAQVGFREGEISLTPTGLKVGLFSIPVEKLPEILYSPLEEKLNDYLASLPVRITDIQVQNGCLLLAG